jgi:Zn finger protein HypA/HybF involved in hydrogenase expression
MSIKNLYSDEEIKSFLLESSSFWQFCKKLGYTNKSGTTYDIVKKDLDNRGIKLPIFRKGGKSTKKKTHSEIFCEFSTYDRKDLKKRILKDDILKYECLKCSISEWMGNPISLQIDHINGVNNDNRIENLRFLCPNCHSQTDTWGNKKRT